MRARGPVPTHGTYDLDFSGLTGSRPKFELDARDPATAEVFAGSIMFAWSLE